MATSVLAGTLTASGRAAVDGDPATAWQTAFGGAVGAAVTVHAGAPLTVDHLDLQIVNDGHHSVPTAITVAAGGEQREVTLPPVPEEETPVAVPVSFAPLTGNDLTVTIAAVESRTTIDRRYGEPVQLPAAIAELGLPGYTPPPVPSTFSTRCYTDRLTVDGGPVPFRLEGNTAAALAGGALTIEPCGAPLALVARRAHPPLRRHHRRRRPRGAQFRRARGGTPARGRRRRPASPPTTRRDGASPSPAPPARSGSCSARAPTPAGTPR